MTDLCCSIQILASDVDFWKLHEYGRDLELMALNSIYPPRFKLVIHGRNAEKPAIAQILFTGAQEDLNTDILIDPEDGRYNYNKFYRRHS